MVALGAALLHLRAADALHPMFLAGTPGYVPGVADELTTQMAAVQVMLVMVVALIVGCWVGV